MADPISALAGRRILVVEDEYLIAMDMKRWLQAAGAEVIGPVPSADQALALIEDEALLDGAVLDVNLGGGSTTYPVADRLGVLGVPFLFATADVKLASASIHQDRPRLEKPVFETELVPAVVMLVASSQPAP